MPTRFARIPLSVFGLIAIAASTGQAQRIEATNFKTKSDSVVSSSSSTTASRVLLSVGGAAIGTFAGGYIGYHVLSHDCGGCDDPGLEAIILGAFAGMTVGAALGAAGPGDSVCSFDRRFARSLAGAGIAAGGAFFVAGINGSIITVPAGAIGGSLAALGRCWKSRR